MFGKLIVPVIKLALVLIFIFSLYAFLRLFKDLDAISFLFITIASSTSVLELVPIAIVMSSMFDTSTQFPRKLAPRIISLVENEHSRQIFKRCLKACAVIRCKVGNLYHMEAEAKLTMFQYLINGAVFLMVNAK